MAFHGKMIVNSADCAPFTLYSVGVFMAPSGFGACRNHTNCSAVANIGPVLPESYMNYDIARKLALFINAGENAESMDDADAYIDGFTTLVIIRLARDIFCLSN